MKKGWDFLYHFTLLLTFANKAVVMFARHLTKVAPLKDRQKCSTGSLTYLVEFHSNILFYSILIDALNKDCRISYRVFLLSKELN